tara:strand:- start:244 stop:486 length:243 start_codon:yes stop_codon:yes gene_type:complete
VAQVTLPDDWAAVTGGTRVLEITADDFRDLRLLLTEQWPDLGVLLDRCAVAIDGQIYQDAFMESLEPDSEVFFMPRIEGG